MNTDKQLIKHFIAYCKKELGIQSLPDIKFVADKSWVQDRHSFGEYSPHDRVAYVYYPNRCTADVFRSLAHELTHHRQGELNMIQQGAGETGSELENEANAMAGIIMREYGKLNPTIYDLDQPTSNPEQLQETKEQPIQYTKPNFEFEWQEANRSRYPEFQQMGKDKWIELAKKGYATKYSKIKDVLSNVDPNFDRLDPDKKERFEKAFATGKIELPMVVKFNENDYDLLGGNTRVAGLLKNKIDPKLWVVDASNLESYG